MQDKRKIWILCLQFFVSFVCVSLVLDVVYEKFIIRKNPFSNFNKLNRLIHSTEENEIPVFGSSKARSAFIPDSIAQNVYNYAMPRSNFDVIELLLQIETEKKKNTPIIIEFNHRFFVHNPAHTINVATYVPNVSDSRVYNYLKKYNRLEYYYFIPGLRYYGNYMNFINNDLRESLGSDKIFSKGSIISYKRAKPEVFEKFVRGRMDAMASHTMLIEKINNPKAIVSYEEVLKKRYLDKFLLFDYDTARIKVFENILKNNPSRDFILVYTPQHPSEMSGIKNYSEIITLMSQLSGKYANFHFLNYANFPLKDEDYKDSSHLNSYGANAFCKKLRQDLLSNPKLQKFFIK